MIHEYINNVYVINLDKDTQRLKDTLEECKKLKIKPTRIRGIYGKKLTESQIKDNTDWVFPFLPAVGCALSHISAWKKMIKNKDKSALIVEDDITIDENFIEKFNKLNIPKDYYILYLGCSIGADPEKNHEFEYPLLKLYTGNNAKQTKIINENIYVPSIPVTFHGYILSRKGAKHLLKCIKKDKIQKHIDAQVIKYIHKVPSYAVTPQLVKQKNVSENTSNNACNFPKTFNTVLSKIKDKNGFPVSYKLSLGLHEIYGYIVNIYTILFIFVGLILGFKNTNTVFLLFLAIEYYLSDKDFTFIKNISIAYFLSIFLPSFIKVWK